MDEYVKIQDVRTALLKIKWTPIEWHNIKWALSSVPAAKVHEEIAAEWEYDSDNLPICNNCEEVALQRLHLSVDKFVLDCRFELSRYCPNCGARMTSQRECGGKT